MGLPTSNFNFVQITVSVKRGSCSKCLTNLNGGLGGIQIARNDSSGDFSIVITDISDVGSFTALLELVGEDGDGNGNQDGLYINKRIILLSI